MIFWLIDKILKNDKKKTQLHDSFKFYNPMLVEVYLQQNQMQNFLKHADIFGFEDILTAADPLGQIS